MKTVKVIVEVKVKADPFDPEALREAVYDELTSLMESDDLEFVTDHDHESDDDDDFDDRY